MSEDYLNGKMDGEAETIARIIAKLRQGAEKIRRRYAGDNVKLVIARTFDSIADNLEDGNL